MNTKKRTRRRKWATGLVVFSLLIGASVTALAIYRALPADEYSGLDEIDRTMFDQLAAQYEVSSTASQKIWTETYRYDQEPLVLIRTDIDRSVVSRYTYLINMSDFVDTSRMRQVSFDQYPTLSDVHVSNTFELTNVDLLLPANFTVDTIGDREVLLFKCNPAMFSDAPPDGLPFDLFSMHEAFHVNKQFDWTYDEDAGDRIFDYPYTDEHFRLLQAEYAILGRVEVALEDTEPDRARLDILATDLAHIRAARYARWPQLSAQDNTEAIEGTAKYVERAYQITQGVRPQPLNFAGALDILWSDPDEQSILERTAGYYTGAQLGFLLDQIRPDWKLDIEPAPRGAGMTPADSLREATGVSGAPSDAVVDDIVDRYAMEMKSQ